MQVAKIRKKAILVELDNFGYLIDGTSYALNTVFGTYFINLTDLFSARLGQYIKCSSYIEPANILKTYDSLLQKARALRLEEGYDYVAFISKDYISHPLMPPQAEGLDWVDFVDSHVSPEYFCFVKFDASQWEFQIKWYNIDPIQAAIFHGGIWLLSHELNHMIAWDYNQTSHDYDYTAMLNYTYYDQRFNEISPTWSNPNWHLIGARSPECWMIKV